jgi:hypothetical protein
VKRKAKEERRRVARGGKVKEEQVLDEGAESEGGEEEIKDGKDPVVWSARPEKMIMEENGTRGSKRQSAGIYQEMKKVESVCGRVAWLGRGDGEQPHVFIERTAFLGIWQPDPGVYHMYDDGQALHGVYTEMRFTIL